MDENEESVRQLRERRAQAQRTRDERLLRASRGVSLATVVAEALSESITVDSFDVAHVMPPIEWPADIRNAPGLVAAYIGKSEALELLQHIGNSLSELNGRIGFHELPYLGFARVHRVAPVCLLKIAEDTEESVIFHIDAPVGVMMVDCYPSQPCEPFSILVQGEELVDRLTLCFRSFERNE